MHTVLQTTELAELICTQLRWTNPGTLAALAQTCTNLQEIALDVLWHRQADIFNLLRCIPEGLWSVKKAQSPYDDSLLDFVRPISQADAAVMVKYSHRVKFLSCSSHTRLDAWDLNILSAYEALWRYCQEAPVQIFPNVQKLDWAVEGPDAVDTLNFMRVVCGPRLSSVYMLRCNDAFVNALPLASDISRLTDLVIYPAGERENKTLEGISDLIQKLQDIRSLTIGAANLDAIAVEHLSRLRSLHTLKLLVLAGSLSLSSLPPSSLEFPELRTFFTQMHGAGDSERELRMQLFSLLRAWDGVKLKKFEVSARGCPSADFLDEIFLTFATHCEPTWLATFLFKCSASRTAISPLPILRASALRHLFRFVHLEKVKIQLPGIVDLDDELLTELAHSWPRLHRLEMTRSFSEKDISWVSLPPRPSATLLGLQALAHRCTSLESLILTIDTTRPDPQTWLDAGLFTLPGANAAPASVLNSFGVADSPLENGMAVGWFLAVTFPHLAGDYVYTAHQVYPYRDNHDDALEEDEGDEEELSERQEIFKRYGQMWSAMERILPEVKNAIADGATTFAECQLAGGEAQAAASEIE
ncbi:hypothetical protein C8F01DRAFT_1371721 [Mycena amicta]|nr:hypothetical protein C8F01DRAFT_1371721 [Mycena amicta]